MAKYRTTEAAVGQGLFLNVYLKEQLLPGTFEHMLDRLIGTEISTEIFDQNYRNDTTGASAVPPDVLLKLIIYGYSKGYISSRGLYELNKNNIVAKALSGDMDIHWTTIASFIAKNSEAFKDVFKAVLFFCNELGLIGGETFGVDGLRLPSNASIEKSGTKAQLEKRLEMYQRMAEKHLERHQSKDTLGEVDEHKEKLFNERQKDLANQITSLSGFLKDMQPKAGKGGQELQSNVTDNESAMIKSAKGFIQGYIGIAVSDAKNQVITSAQAVGTANEGEHLPDLLDTNTENLQAAGVQALAAGNQPVVLADANYFSEDNLQACAARGIAAVISDGRGNQSHSQPIDSFTYNADGDYYTCPAGKQLGYKYDATLRNGAVKVYQGSLTDCRQCACFSTCSKSKKNQSEITQGRKVLVRSTNEPESQCAQMRGKLKTAKYQEQYSRRIQIIEPVFANIGYCKGMDRFTLRGKEKVNGQWQLYCIVHNLGKCMNELNIRGNAA